jgi:hypothetical protein
MYNLIYDNFPKCQRLLGLPYAAYNFSSVLIETLLKGTDGISNGVFPFAAFEI